MPASAHCRGRCITLHPKKREIPTPPITVEGNISDFPRPWPLAAIHAGCGRHRALQRGARAGQTTPRNRGYELRDITPPRASNRDNGPRNGLSLRGATIRRDLGKGGPAAPPRHSAGPPRETLARATPRRKRSYARRTRRTPGREARAFALNRSACRFRGRLLK